MNRQNTGKPELRIGTSGWSYDHWEGPFYPADLAQGERLAHYREHFDTVEINNTFYQVPEEGTFRTWLDEVSADFEFAVKANRYITHMKKLKDPREPLENFFQGITRLRENLGPILFQLPPNWHYNHGRLEEFLEALPAGRRYTFEFRDPEWINARSLRLLEGHGAAFCIYDYEGRTSPKHITANFVYIRLHGPTETAYEGRYTTVDLAGWAGAVSGWLESGKDVYCYFDNDYRGYAVENALELVSMLE